MKKAPYFINPAIEALPSATGEERKALVRLIAANVGDEATLRAILGIDPEEFKNFYPDLLPPDLSTEDTINSFISRFSSEEAAKAPEIEEIVTAPAIDYAYMLEQEEEDEEIGDDGETDETQDAISAFLKAVPPKMRVRKKASDAPVNTPADAPSEAPGRAAAERNAAGGERNLAAAGNAETSSDLSDALFKMMVKNRNYEKALEIITELSLKNPKKSIYFAYQTRFLKKLIQNQAKSQS